MALRAAVMRTKETSLRKGVRRDTAKNAERRIELFIDEMMEAAKQTEQEN